MIEIIAHELQYCGGCVDCDLDLVHYQDHNYEGYKDIYNDCFRPMRIALELSPDCCGTREQLLKNQSSIYLLMHRDDLVGSVALYQNEINDLIVNPNYQGKGYGKKLLLFAIHAMQGKGETPIVLHVADWNKRAYQLYIKTGFQCVKTERVR